MENKIINVNKDADDCEYCIETYAERDTGYSEYKCELTGLQCTYNPELCPLSFKYGVEK